MVKPVSRKTWGWSPNLRTSIVAEAEQREVSTMPTVFRGPVAIYHDDKSSAFKIELRFGDPDLDQIVEARAREFDNWMIEQRALMNRNRTRARVS